MDKRSASRRGDHDENQPERRASGKVRGMSRALNLLKNLWARPLGLQRRGPVLKLVLVERRRPPSPDEPPKLAQIRSELRERLLGQNHAHAHAHAAQVMRHLARVHDELGRAGWPAVEVLPAQVLGLATVQAEMLASVGPSAVMVHLVERLRIFKVAADVREERGLRQAHAARARTAVSADAAEAPAPVEADDDEDTGRWTGPVPLPEVVPEVVSDRVPDRKA